MRVLDISALGPGPFCSMLLANFGAEVIAVERQSVDDDYDLAPFFSRGKRSIVVDLRNPAGAQVLKELAVKCDVFLEGYRPGVMERRGLGPAELLKRNPRLVYTRLTGYGQSGPYSQRAGHDINYIATAGLLGVLGDSTNGPSVPLNILGDFASGSLMAAFGTVMALLERNMTGQGQIVDAAMVDGAAALLSAQLAEFATGQWAGPGRGVLSGAAPFYGVYQCSDGKWFSVGAIEGKFYRELLEALGLPAAAVPSRSDTANWPRIRSMIADVFKTRPQSHWAEVFGKFDACGAAVHSLEQLLDDPHLRERGTIVEHEGWIDAAPSPRLSGFDPAPASRVTVRGQHTHEVLLENGWRQAEIEELLAGGAIEAAQVWAD
ncbi:CoA transferase [Mycobacterium intracellulare]|nr:CoA transferase [Mycobacterium intracellulare]